MKIEIRFTGEESRRLQWLLRERYSKKSRIQTLAKKAIREVGAMQARRHLIHVEDESVG